MGKRRRRTSSSTVGSPSSSSSTSSCSSHSSCSSDLKYSDARTVFAVMLAALSNREFQKPTSEVLRETLEHLLLSLLSKSLISILHSQRTLPVPLISLLPVLLSSKCSEIARSGLEIVGAASLFSIEMNEQVAFDDEIVKGLMASVASAERSVSVAACNALLDLLTTSVGRCRLLEFSALENLILCFLQVPRSSAPSISLIMEDADNKSCFRIGFMEDEYPILLLHVTITLINDCTIEQLERIPTELSTNLLLYLKTLWAEIHNHILINSIQEYDSDRLLYSSNIRTNNIAESLFRLSTKETFAVPPKFQEVKRSIFDSGQISFEHFILNHWEASPLLITRPSNASLHNDIFSEFLQFLGSKENISSFLASLLQNLTSALPISSDELDTIRFLKEVREHIGCPIIYQQDIRVVKTPDSKGEMHFFQESSDSRFLYARDILRYGEAYNDGYTFALRGMEFRFEDIASISEGLASLFGQPSAGVNMYLTPPDSQGLSRHRDDHCVLVCQIRGVKRWKVFPNPSPRLPRLYEPVDDAEGEKETIDGCEEFLLREGDVLYIPRGFPHEARTVNGPNGDADFSLHLTLAVEIEPPFEWEGFAHVALHSWARTHDRSNHVSVHLMHIAIKLVGDTDPTFRKACLVNAAPFPSNQKPTFAHVLDTIGRNAEFEDAVSNVESIHVFESLRWLRHLDKKTPSTAATEDLFGLLIERREEVEAAFMDVKSRFCDGAVFEDVLPHYRTVFDKYKGARKRYMNGMLSLNRG